MQLPAYIKRFSVIIVMIVAAMACKASDEVEAPDLTAEVMVPDSLPVAPPQKYWLTELKHLKFNPATPNVYYPKFLKFCVDVYNWGDRFFNTYDHRYVEPTGKRWKVILKNDNWVDSYAMHLGPSVPIRMLSDIYSDIGGTLSYMAVSGGYAFNMTNLIGKKKITRDRFDFQFSCALFSADFSMWRNNGGSIIRQFGPFKASHWENIDFPGIKIKSMGLDVYYFINNKKYSQAAAYNYSKIQRRSQGSFITGISIARQDTHLDFSVLPADVLQKMQLSQTAYRFNYNDYGVIIGYGYNWVFRRNWVFNISALPTVGFKHTNGVRISSKDATSLSLNIKGKMALVYNYRNLFVALNAKMDGHWYNNNGYSYFNSIENLALLTGFRF